ncbi:unnamed protein product [Bursaphelenchus xylophilus]|uniref:Galactosylgalactosylxylosylprotein 3-beta-glucuronosyltransferase n=1 Tax=Bursaphelenchus xylophilus TaxID=6326 RepID=A0A1I7RM28_BURXY|nr:unnamed protein product [Bursaphelenchus xylophilus]CAG9118150.1 unnamed protein product [Bursaphelenchus xylophilus]
MPSDESLLRSISTTETEGSSVTGRSIKKSSHPKNDLDQSVWKIASIFLFCALGWALSIIVLVLLHKDPCPNTPISPKNEEDVTNEPKIFVITPTYARPERMADLTMLAQVLMHVKNLHWLVVEDGGRIAEPVARLLQRSNIEHTYFSAVTPDYLPKRGWAQRNAALFHLRDQYINYKDQALVYFADDDNSYDHRVFHEYIRKVKRLGVWAVGLAGTSRVEAPRVENNTVVGWDVYYRPHRKYAVDMAGFAVSLRLVLRSLALFGKECVGHDPEDCFLRQLSVPMNELEPFGCDNDPKDILVWHTKTVVSKMRGETYGYVFEEKNV